MPTYVITAPDGNEYEVDAPEGASEADVLAYAQQNYKGAKPKKPKAWDYNPTGLSAADGVTRQVGATADALQHRLIDVPLGVAQLVGNAVNSGVQAVAGDTEWGRGVNARNEAQNRQVAKREADYQARTGTTAGSYAGSVAGQALPWIFGLGALRSAGALPTLARTRDVAGMAGKAGNLAAKGGLLAAEGAAIGATVPVTGGDFWTGKTRDVGTGAALGPLVAGAGAAAVSGARGARQATRYLTPGGRETIANERLAGMLGDDPNILNTLSLVPQYVPGEVPTLGQAIGTPRAVQIDRAMRNNPQAGAAFADQEVANNAARMAVARRLAGTDADMEAAKRARTEATQSFYREHLTPGPEKTRFSRAQKTLTDFMSQGRRMSSADFDAVDAARRIAGQVQRGTLTADEGLRAIAALQVKSKTAAKAMEQATTILNGNMVKPDRILKVLDDLAVHPNSVVRSAAGEQAALIRTHIDRDGSGMVPAYLLDGVRRNVGRTLQKHAPNGAVGSEEGAIYGPVAAKIASTLDRAIPGYRDNLAAYARLSAPINDMEAARRLVDGSGMGGLDSSGGSVLSIPQLRQTLRLDDRANFPMTDAARGEMENILASLQRRSITDNKIAASGPGTAAEVGATMLDSPLGRALGAGGGGLLGTVAGGPVGGALGILLSEGAQAARRDITRRVGEKAANSTKARAALEAAQRQRQKALGSGVPQYLLPWNPR